MKFHGNWNMEFQALLTHQLAWKIFLGILRNSSELKEYKQNDYFLGIPRNSLE